MYFQNPAYYNRCYVYFRRWTQIQVRTYLGISRIPEIGKKKNHTMSYISLSNKFPICRESCKPNVFRFLYLCIYEYIYYLLIFKKIFKPFACLSKMGKKKCWLIKIHQQPQVPQSDNWLSWHRLAELT